MNLKLSYLKQKLAEVEQEYFACMSEYLGRLPHSKKESLTIFYNSLLTAIEYLDEIKEVEPEDEQPFLNQT